MKKAIFAVEYLTEEQVAEIKEVLGDNLAWMEKGLRSTEELQAFCQQQQKETEVLEDDLRNIHRLPVLRFGFDREMQGEIGLTFEHCHNHLRVSLYNLTQGVAWDGVVFDSERRQYEVRGLLEKLKTMGLSDSGNWRVLEDVEAVRNAFIARVPLRIEQPIPGTEVVVYQQDCPLGEGVNVYVFEDGPMLRAQLRDDVNIEALHETMLSLPQYARFQLDAKEVEEVVDDLRRFYRVQVLESVSQ